MRREICKTQFLHYFKISKFVVESVAKTKAAAAMSNPLSPMKSPRKQAASNATRSSPIKVDLTTDGLWAMPLNEGWVPVKARRLQDWQKLKKYVPVHKQGDVCPNGVPALPEKSNADSDSDSE